MKKFLKRFIKSGTAFGGSNSDWFWFYWWNWLPRTHRYWGYEEDWHDGQIYHFGFWFFNWSWNFTLTDLYRFYIKKDL